MFFDEMMIEDTGMGYDFTEEERYERDVLDLAFSNFGLDFKRITSDMGSQYSDIRDYVYDFLTDEREHGYADVKSWISALVFDEDLVEAYIEDLLCRHYDDGLTRDMLVQHPSINDLRYVQDKMVCDLITFAEKYPYVGECMYYSDPE